MKLQTALISLAIGGTGVYGRLENSNRQSGASNPNTPQFSGELCKAWIDNANESDTDGSGGLSSDEFLNFLKTIEQPASVEAYFADKDVTAYDQLEFIYKIIHKSLACQCHLLGLGDDCCVGDNAEIPVGVTAENAIGAGAMASDAAIAEFRNTLCNDISAGFGQTVNDFADAESNEVVEATVAATTVVTPPATVDVGPITTTTTTEGTDAPPTTTSEAATTTTEETTTTTTTTTPTATTTTTSITTTSTTEAPADTTEAPPSTEAPADTTEAPPANTTTEATTTTTLAPEIVEIINCLDMVTGGIKEGCTCKDINFEAIGDVSAIVDALAAAGVTPGIFETCCMDDTTNEEFLSCAKLSSLGMGGGEPTPDDEVDVDDTVPPSDDEVMSLEIDIIGSAYNTSQLGTPEFFDAADVVENTDDNNILSNLIFGFASVSAEILLNDLDNSGSATAEGKKKMIRRLRGGGRLSAASLRKLQSDQLTPVVVTDIPCPEEIAYTPPTGVTCLNFRLNIDTGSMPEENVPTFEEQINAAVKAGDLYITILEMFPTTNITGLGEPGAGYDYTTGDISGAEAPSVDKGTEPPPEDTDSGGLSAVAIVFIIIAIVVVPMMIVAMFARYRKVQNEERLAKLRDYQAEHGPIESREIPRGSESDSDFIDEEGASPKKLTAGSSLAAIGAAGAAAALVTKRSISEDDLDKIKAEIRTLVDETNAPKSADELLVSYAGREKELLKNLRKMKAKLDKDAAIKAEVEQLVEETNAPKTAEEMLASYKGREEELLKNLRKMRNKQISIEKSKEEKEAIKAEVEQLVKETNSPKSAEDLLATYEGREEELLKNLRKMRGVQVKEEVMRIEIENLVKAVDAPKTAEEMLETYKGREEDLLKNLQKMKAKQDRAKAKRDSLNVTQESEGNIGDIVIEDTIKSQIVSLVNETNPGKSAEDLIEAYGGREPELIAHLTKLKESKLSK